LPKGSYIKVIDNGTRDTNIYPDPEKFDAWRYLRMRERPGEENHHQFVATSPDNMGFGHGMHACPGRFFASNEIKIIFCFLLIEFEWRYGPGQGRLPDQNFEGNIMADPATAVQVRKRESEMDILRPMV
jgi:cytochrome P450